MADAPEPPADWSDDDPRRAVWGELAPRQLQRQTLHAGNAPLFEAYCDAVASHRELSDVVRRDGHLIAGPKDAVTEHPAVKTLAVYAGLIVKLGARFQ